MRAVQVAYLIGWLVGVGCGSTDPEATTDPEEPVYEVFSSPVRVVIEGYDADAMEPFLSRDGRYLFFNNLNDPSVNTELHVAERVDALRFTYRGPLTNANTEALEGVPTMDRSGTLYFVSTRSYPETLSTLYRGRFDEGAIEEVELVPGVSREEAGIVNFDVEVSPDGTTLYIVDAQFSDNVPETANLIIATRVGDQFVRAPNSDEILQEVNTDALEYAAAITNDGLELFFTRFTSARGETPPQLYRSVRATLDAPFGTPQRVEAATGFVEGPTLDPDDRALYYHKREGGRFVIYYITR
ncbi:MAG: hypothetical protein AAGI71_18910 [Bacteroidota bacterium]